MPIKNLGKRFKELREKDLDLGQVELAKMLGVTQATVSAVETGKNKGLSLENLIKLVEICKDVEGKYLSLNWLIMDFGSKFISSVEETNAQFDELVKKEDCYFDENGFLRKK